MTESVYNYPKSLCDCYDCDDRKYKTPEGVSTNMSVPDCTISKYYDCYSKRTFKIQQEPVNRDGSLILNKSLLDHNKFDPTFKTINSKSRHHSSCKETTYLNSDPRLLNAAGGTRLQLDRPPRVTNNKLKDLINDKSLDNYGQGYKSYNDVDAGQILYYINKDFQDAFYEPLFSEKATAVGTMYKDPMGNMRPQYDRIPNEKYDPILGNTCDNGEYCLSWMKDTQFHREDLLARQMRSNNETRYAPRWTNTL